MSPKKWSNAVTVTERQVQELVMDHAKTFERMSWKAMDPLEFAEAHLEFMKSLAKYSVRINKHEFGSAVRKSKIKLTSSEVALLSEKVASCIHWLKQKLRDAGSGKFLPAPCLAIQKAWRRHEKPAKPRRNERMPKKHENPKKDEEADEKEAKKKANEDDKPKQDMDIRMVFGLPPKEIVKLDLSSDQDCCTGIPSSKACGKNSINAPKTKQELFSR